MLDAMTSVAASTIDSARGWRQDPRLIRLLRNSTTLLAGQTTAGLLGIGSLALTVRALGAETFGLLVLITTYVLVVDTLLNFQSWQAVTRYGARALEHGEDAEFRSIVKFGLFLDSGTAVVATILASVAAGVVVRWQGWDPQLVPMCMLYSLTLLFHVAGTPTAVLRLFDRFDLVVYSQVLGTVLRFAGVLAAFLVGGGLWLFLMAWAAGDIIGKLSRIIFSFRELSRRGFYGIAKASLTGMSRRFEGLWSFVWTTNIHSSVKLALREIDILLVGLWLGVAGAGLYKIVKAVGSRVGKLATPLQQAIYPDLARLAASKEYLNLSRLVIRPMLIIAVLSACVIGAFMVTGRPFVTAIFGAEFDSTFIPMVIYLIGTFIGMATFPFHPTLMAVGRAGVSLAVLSASSVVYLSALYFGATRFGLSGAAAAYVLFYLVWATVMLVILHRYYRRIDSNARGTY
jgi:O-antigen/teichoic acid export membrane protein